LVLALTRAAARLLIFGDPGTLARRTQWQGPLDHLDEAASERERDLVCGLVAYLQGHGRQQSAVRVSDGHGGVRRSLPGSASSPPAARHPLALPAARSFTSPAGLGLPPLPPSLPQSPPLTSSTITKVTGRMFSPSMETMASVSLRIMSRFWASLKTPSITLT